MEEDADSESTVYWYNLEERTAEATTITEPKTAPLSNSLVFRLRASMDIQFQLNSDASKTN